MRGKAEIGFKLDPMLIRDATEADLPEILVIHNAAIEETTAIWDTATVGIEDRRAWFDLRASDGHPILVAEIDERVAGYASYGQFRPKSGFRQTVENSVYVSNEFHRRGAATSLMAALIERARASDVHVMVAGIESTNATSITLHEKFGFGVVAEMPEVGRKFDRWLDMTFMQLTL